jgi:hypothetical protein
MDLLVDVGVCCGFITLALSAFRLVDAVVDAKVDEIIHSAVGLGVCCGFMALVLSTV